MNIKSLLRNIGLTILFAAFMVLTSILVTLVVTRALPLSAFLANHSNAINSAPGAQFVNAVFPVNATGQALRARWSPWLPAIVGVSIVRKVIKPLDNFLKRTFPPSQNQATEAPSINNMLIPSADQELLDVLAGGTPSALAKQSGKIINLSLSFLFLILLLFCLLLTFMLIRKLVRAAGSGSKQLARSGAQFFGELRALPQTVKAISAEPKKVVRKRATKKKEGAEKA